MDLGRGGEMGFGLIESVERGGEKPEVVGDCGPGARVGERELVTVGGEQAVELRGPRAVAQTGSEHGAGGHAQHPSVVDGKSGEAGTDDALVQHPGLIDTTGLADREGQLRLKGWHLRVSTEGVLDLLLQLPEPSLLEPQLNEL